MPRSTKPQRLGEVIDRVVDQMGIRDELHEAQIIETWANLAGDEVNARTDSAWIKGGVLFIKINSPTLRHHLHMHRSAWRDRLNLELGNRAIKSIAFR